MEYRPLGASGIEASVVALGTWAIGGWLWGGTDERKSVEAIQAAAGAGINFIDTAPANGMGLSETIVGKAVARRRGQVVIATKCGLVWHTNKGAPFLNQDGKPSTAILGRSRFDMKWSRA
jgi:methylglyoxal reductase